MGLKRYREKRRFAETPEPKGALSRAKAHRFVIHKHAATHLHYDVRLEWGGALKSWAVPKGPPRKMGERHLAIHVEDHPLAYRTFHGVIPKGNYGAGKVEIWDEGTFTVRGAVSFAETERLLKKKFRNGEISFTLHGKKLKGDYSLVKMEGAREKDAWLFLKKKPAADPRPARFIEAPKATRAPMPHAIRPMLAEIAKEPFSRAGWIFEVKWDGYRAIAEIKNRKAALFSRSGQSFTTKFREIANALATLPIESAVFDGEIVALDGKGLPKFQLLQEHGETGEGDLAYEVFDLLYLNGRDIRSLPLSDRKSLLKEIIPAKGRVRYSDHIEADGKRFFQNAKRQGLEGVMAKRADSPYQTGRRTGDWLKMKAIARQEAVIAGFTEPRGSRKGIGAVILGVQENGKLTYIGHTGGGSDAKTLGELRKKLEPMKIKTPPFENPPKPNAPVHWVKPKLVCEVKFQEWTADGIMRQPIFLGLREDKPAVEVVREGSKPEAERETIRVGKTRIRFTHADKIFWPKEKITKGDLLAYYLDVAPFILPSLKDRPESLHRFPNGIDGEDFYQKDVTDVPRGMKTVRIRSESEEKILHAPIVNDTAMLAELVQLGCIDINPWNSRIGHLGRPDYLIFDLDPEGVPFSVVIRTARAVKDALDAAGVESTCKTSGKRGMHIYVPLGAKYTYEQVRLFGQVISQMVQAKLPQLVSLERSPSKRQRRVYIDVPQNKRGATTVAPYSVRPVPGATVSAPLRWSEVKAGLTPGRFTIRTMKKRLKQVGDLWKPVRGKGIDLEACLRKLEKRRT